MFSNVFGLRHDAQSRSTRQPDRRRLSVECLEDRVTPSTFTVTTRVDVVDPTDGKLSLREAITRANNHAGTDTIVLPAGVTRMGIAGTGDDANASGDFDITDSVVIRGAGAGVTIVDARQIDRVFDVFGTVSEAINVVMERLTIRNGNSVSYGGGIQVNNANLVLRDSLVTGNRSSSSGGGIASFGDPGMGEDTPVNLTLVRTTVARNVAGEDGGGIRIAGNKGLLTVKNSTVRRNLALFHGGGIYAHTSTVTNSAVSGNSAGGFGGGIQSPTATLTNSTVGGNTASRGGGINASTLATLSGCTVSGNSAGIDGGGIRATNTANLTNCTVSGNTAAIEGGGLFATTATLLNCTVVENIANTGGGLFHVAGGTFNVRNSLIALNLVEFAGTGPDVFGDFTSGGHNLIGDGSGATGFTNGVMGDMVGTSAAPIDPKIGALRNNGGKTKTHALLPGSPAIDRGENMPLPPTDQRGAGFGRRKDGDGNGSKFTDIGAFEL